MSLKRQVKHLVQPLKNSNMARRKRADQPIGVGLTTRQMKRRKPLSSDYLVDIATLTGSATLGLGRQYAALYTRDKKLAKELVSIGERCGERVWHMPLVDDYIDSLESDIADLNHAADKGDYSAGSVTAALYLEHFVAQTRWFHLDIAGTGRSETDAGENAKGGTGFGVRFFLDWILSLS